MKVSDIINRLVAQGNFGRRVRGAAEFVQASEADSRSATMELPHAFVVPRSQVPVARPDDEPGGPVWQRWAENFSVIVALDNRTDQIGESALDAVEVTRDLLFGDLVGHQLTAAHTPIEFTQGSLMRMSKDVLWWDFGFVTEELGGLTTGGDGLWQAEVAGSVILNDADAEAFRLLLNAKIVADSWTGGVTMTLLGTSWDVRRSGVTVSDTLAYFATRAMPIGLPDNERSNVEQLEAGVSLQIFYAPATGTEAAIVQRLSDWLAQLETWAYLELSDVREVVNPLRLTFPDDVTRS